MTPSKSAKILAGAGWKSTARNPFELAAIVDRNAIVDDGQLPFLGVPEDSFDDARRAVDQQLGPLQTADGRIRAPLSVQIFTARA